MRTSACGWALGAALLLIGCDTAVPEQHGLLVVEGFVDAAKPLPPVVLRATGGLGARGPADEVTDADVVLRLDGAAFAYRADEQIPGRYLPVGPEQAAPAGAAFELEVRWREQVARAAGEVPPPIRIDSVWLEVADAPVEAVLLDSLRLDSLGLGGQKGFIYTVDVTVAWSQPPGGPVPGHWIRTHLAPYDAFSSRVLDFFLLPETLQPEVQMDRRADGRIYWTGVYAVPVGGATAPLPRHQVRVSLVRGGSDYARFAASRDAPERREPVSNVQGALGVFTGVSVDSVHVLVE